MNFKPKQPRLFALAVTLIICGSGLLYGISLTNYPVQGLILDLATVSGVMVVVGIIIVVESFIDRPPQIDPPSKT